MTAQVPERLILDGWLTEMSSLPDIPVDHPRIHAVERAGAKYQDEQDRLVFSSACWRNYIGTWELRDGRLYLVKIAGLFQLEGSEPLFASWVNQPLVVPRGKLLRHIAHGFESVHEEDLVISVQNGVEVSRCVVDNRRQAAEQQTPV